jgi:hypothetical protein
MRKFLAALLFTGCGAATMSPPGTTTSPITTWPTFTGDCLTDWRDRLQVKNSNAISNPDPEASVAISDWVEGEQGARAYLSIDFNPADVGKALAIDRSSAGPQARIIFYIGNTTWSQFDQGVSGSVHGTLTVERFDPSSGRATFDFSHATLMGEDSVYAGTYRCGIDGTLDIAAFSRTELGERCGADLECGGAYSGRVCSNESFACEAGCHQETDCPLGKSCVSGSCQ